MAKNETLMDEVHGQPWTRAHFEETRSAVAACLYLIDATSEQRSSLWREYSSRSESRSDKLRAPLEWMGGAGGPIVTVGRLDGRPVTLSMFVDHVAGIPICFIHSSSRVVDHDMIDRFLEIVMPGVPREDAGNFQAFVRSRDMLAKITARREDARQIAQAARPGVPGESRSL